MPVFADKSPPPVTTKLEVGTRFTKILETEPNSPCFTQNHPKTQKSMDFNQNYLEPVKLPISGDVFMTEPPAAILESPTGAAIILALKNPSKTAEISQKQPESPVSEHFKWTDDTDSLPTSSIAHMKHPHNLSGLHSSSMNPFSSLRCCKGTYLWSSLGMLSYYYAHYLYDHTALPTPSLISLS